MNPTPINATPGAEILPAFRAAEAASQALQPRPGHGSSISKTPLGYSISGKRRATKFPHCWAPTLSFGAQPAIYLSKGLVDGLTPIIRIGAKEVPMTGDAKHPRPTLKLLATDIDRQSQESWVCLEVYPEEDGNLTKESLIEIVHRDAPLSNDPDVGRQPLVHLLWRDDRPAQAIPVTFFNLRYYRTTPRDGEGVPQHFFL